jgi:hypothetical protein
MRRKSLIRRPMWVEKRNPVPYRPRSIGSTRSGPLDFHAFLPRLPRWAKVVLGEAEGGYALSYAAHL